MSTPFKMPGWSGHDKAAPTKKTYLQAWKEMKGNMDEGRVSKYGTHFYKFEDFVTAAEKWNKTQRVKKHKELLDKTNVSKKLDPIIPELKVDIEQPELSKARKLEKDVKLTKKQIRTTQKINEAIKSGDKGLLKRLSKKINLKKIFIPKER